MYVVALTDSTEDRDAALTEPLISDPALEAWLRSCPELRVDGEPASPIALAERLESFWLPDEVILYVGLAGTSLGDRVAAYYRTPLGARRPHAGGYFLKTLSSLDRLHVHYSRADDPRSVEDEMLGRFVSQVSAETRARLHDSERPFPFANLEWPPGTRKRHGLTGTKSTAAPTQRSRPDQRRVAQGGSRPPGKVTLHAEIERILREKGNRWMTVQEIADEVTRAGNYRKRDGSAMTAFQVHGRTKNYPHLFERDGSRVRLKE